MTDSVKRCWEIKQHEDSIIMLIKSKKQVILYAKQRGFYTLWKRL